MARPKKDHPKDQVIHVRMDEKTYQKLCADAKEAGMPISTYVRHKSLSAMPASPKILFRDTRGLEAALREVNRIGERLNPIARHLNSGGYMTNAIAKELHEILQEMDAALVICGEELDKAYGGPPIEIDLDDFFPERRKQP